MPELSINRVNLMMGNSCNDNCRHCIQTASKHCPPEQKKAIPDVVGYIAHLAAIRPAAMDKLKVFFWGGEPLLYMDTIKDVIKRLGPAVEYALVTNGSMLSMQHVDYFNVNHVTVMLSNDGAETERVRGENLLEHDDFLRIFKRLERKGIDACISAYNQDFYVLWEYLEGKLGKEIPISHELLKITWDMSPDLYNFDLQAFTSTMDRISANAHKKLLDGEIGREFDLIYPTVKRLLKLAEGKGRENLPHCGQLHSMISLDLDGAVYACHNNHTVLGSVADDYETLVSRYADFIGQKNAECCKTCPYLAVCHGGCPYEINKKTCAMRKIFIDACMDFVNRLKPALEDVDLEDSYVCD